jgi:hypothetical protein
MQQRDMVLAGSGTQTAALALEVEHTPGPGITGATEEYNGASWSSGGLTTARFVRRSRNSNSSISFWWKHGHLLQMQQKNMMDLLGQLE